MLTKDAAWHWLRPLANRHVDEGLLTFTATAYAERPGAMSAPGIQADLDPQAGRVVEISADWCLVKTGPNTLFVAARRMLVLTPEVGATVKVTPYARRGFDGRRLDADGSGEEISRLPIPKETLRCASLRDLMVLVEELRAPDRVRRLSQVLLDAGALTGPVAYKDPVKEDERFVQPTLQCRIATSKFKGCLNIVCDMAVGSYVVQLVEPNTAEVVQQVFDVSSESLAQVVADLVDDGQWRLAAVDVLKHAPKRRKPAASHVKLRAA